MVNQMRLPYASCSRKKIRFPLSHGVVNIIVVKTQPEQISTQFSKLVSSLFCFGIHQLSAHRPYNISRHRFIFFPFQFSKTTAVFVFLFSLVLSTEAKDFLCFFFFIYFRLVSFSFLTCRNDCFIRVVYLSF